MNTKQYLPAEEVADYFFDHEEELRDTRVTIAEDENSGKVFYLTNEDGDCQLSVLENGEVVYIEDFPPDFAAEINQAAELVYWEFFDVCSPAEMGIAEDAISDREDQMYIAAEDFVDTLLDTYSTDARIQMDIESIASEVLERTCDYLLGLGYRIYRPHWEVDASTGLRTYVEYAEPGC